MLLVREMFTLVKHLPKNCVCGSVKLVERSQGLVGYGDIIVAVVNSDRCRIGERHQRSRPAYHSLA